MRTPLPDPEEIALKALIFLGSDPDRLERFLALTGLDVEGLRRASGEPGFLTEVLEYLSQGDELLLAFASESGFTPETVARARAALSPRSGFD